MDAASSSDLAVVQSEASSKKKTVLALRDMAEEDSLAFKSFLIGASAVVVGLTGRILALFA